MAKTKATGPAGKIEFFENHVPAVPPGDYTIDVTQTVTATPRVIPTDQPPFKAVQHEFSVLGPRFSLDPQMVRTVFPPPGSLGEHSSVLPHITFTRSTLPWERQPLKLEPEEEEALAHNARAELFKSFKKDQELLNALRKKPAVYEALEKSANSVIDGWKTSPVRSRLPAALRKKGTPWLALMLFDQDEIAEKEGNKKEEGIKDRAATIRTCRLHRDGTGPKAPFVLEPKPSGRLKSPWFHGEYGYEVGEPVTVLEVTRQLLQRILPTPEEVRWLAHARQATDGHGHPVSDELATLLCNRLPRPGRRSVVHLVSLEGFYTKGDEKDDVWARAATGGGDRIRLVSLKSWRFACTAEEHSFKGLLQNLDYGHKLVHEKPWTPDETDTPAPAPKHRVETPTTLRLPKLPEGESATSEPYLRRGYVAVPHRMRDGNRSVSWYHGPLAPGKAGEQVPGSLPARSADQLMRYFPECGMFDVAYSSAWELGRLLTLENRSVAIDLLDWKRRHRHGKEQLKARLRLEHLPVEGQRADASLPAKVSRWFYDLSLLKGIPFNYLVPDERMLPQESLRFFWVDSDWVRCLLDGAFSVGRSLPTDLHRDRKARGALPGGDKDREARGAPPPGEKADEPHPLPHAAVTGFLLRSAVVSGWPDLQIDGYDEVVKHENYERSELQPKVHALDQAKALELARRLDAGDVEAARKTFGFPKDKKLLVGPYEPDASAPNKAGSRPAAWVANVGEDNKEIYIIRRHESARIGPRKKWNQSGPAEPKPSPAGPAQWFTATLENKLHLLRMARLSENVLLCLFAGDVATVDIHEKPEALHFGVNRPAHAQKSADRPNYGRELKKPTGQEIRRSVGIPFRKSAGDRVIAVDDTPGAVTFWEAALPELDQALAKEANAKAKESFDALDSAQRQAYLRWLVSASKPGSVEDRVKRAVDWLAGDKKEPQGEIPLTECLWKALQRSLHFEPKRLPFTPAQFALQMVEGVQKVRFVRKE